MKRLIVIIAIIIASLIFVIHGTNVGCVPETQHNGATLCLSCIGVE